MSIGLVLVLLPFIVLAFYNHFLLDDFLDAITVRNLGFWESQKFFYNTLTGRYTTTVLLAVINPLVYGHVESAWWITLAFILGTLMILRYSISALCSLQGKEAWWGGGILTALWLAYAPGHAEGLYWFTGAYTYVVTAWLLMAWLAAMGYYARARKSQKNERTWLSVVCFMTLAVAGTTEPVALSFLLLVLLGACLTTWFKRSRIMWLFAGLATAGCLVSFTAPGNFIRMEFMGNHYGLFKTICYAGATTAYLLMTWLANPVLLLVTLLILPALFKATRNRDNVVIEHLSQIQPFILIAALIGLLVVFNCPPYYASGTGLPLRARNMLYLLFILGWFGVALIWCSRQSKQGKSTGLLLGLSQGSVTASLTALLILFFFADYNFQTRASMLGHGSNNVIRAYRQWLGGDAAAYDAERRARYELIKSSGPIVKILPLKNRPDLLFSFDIADVGDTTMLRQYAKYFNKKLVLTPAVKH